MVQFGDAFLWILGAATIGWAVWYFTRKDKKSKNKVAKYGILIALFWVILVLPSQKYKPSSEVIPQWDSVYSDAALAANIPREYFAETEYYDYNSPAVQSAIAEIRSKANNYEEAAYLALQYVYQRVPYNAYESDAACFQGKSSGVLTSRTGQCDTQTIAVIGIMRGMGIAARPVGGCIYKKAVCKVKQSLMALMAQVGVEIPVEPEPKFTEAANILSRAGGLHAWGEVWFPKEGWVTFESTTGQLIRSSCYEYWVEMYPADDDKTHLCVSTNMQFAQQCRAK